MVAIVLTTSLFELDILELPRPRSQCNQECCFEFEDKNVISTVTSAVNNLVQESYRCGFSKVLLAAASSILRNDEHLKPGNGEPTSPNLFRKQLGGHVSFFLG